MQRSPFHLRPWGQEVIGFFGPRRQEGWRVPADLREKHGLLEKGSNLGHVSNLPRNKQKNNECFLILIFHLRLKTSLSITKKHVDSNVSNALYVVCCRKSNDLWEVLHKWRYETSGYFWLPLLLPLSSHFHTFQCNFFCVWLAPFGCIYYFRFSAIKLSFWSI